MKIQKIDGTNLAEAVVFVTRLNKDLSHKISYFGETGEEIAADFSTVQPPDGYGFIAVGDQGKVVGFFGVELDVELGRSWLLGPLVEADDWEAIAAQLYQAVCAELPEEISNQELFFHGQNLRVEKFALQHGFDYHSEGSVLNMEIIQRQTRDGSRIFELENEKFSQFEALHNKLFPNTYYSAEQLAKIASEEDKCLLVYQKDGVLAGYIFAQLRPASQDVYIDFLGVEPEFRRKGVARDLVAQVTEWAAQHPYVKNISLTVSSDNEAAIGLYHSMGFTTQLVSRAYRKQT